jgi:hypothetical protein
MTSLQMSRHSNPHSKPNRNPPNYSTSEAIVALKDALVTEAQATRAREPEKATTRVIEYVTLAFVILTTIGVGFQDVILHSSDETFKNTLNVQKESSETQLRAYVGIRPLGIDNFGEPNQVLHTMRKNYGSTPASDLFVDLPKIAVIARNSQFDAALCEPSPAAPVNTVSLFPQQELRFDIVLPGNLLTKEQIASVRDGTQFQLQFWGTLHYRDAFGKRRCTRYCWGFRGPKMTENDSDYCAQHNDAY